MNEPGDGIVKEIRLLREAVARSFEYDVRRITEDLQREERESGAKIFQRPLRMARPYRSDRRPTKAMQRTGFAGR